MSQRHAVFLDRDGTLIVDHIYLNDPDRIDFLPGVFEALRSLRDRGFVFCVATNQSGVPRGLVDVRNLDEIHRRIRAQFAGEGVDILSFHCAPYMTDNDHPLRKPNPGMLLEAARWHNLNLSRSWMVGDRMIDVEAGHRAGCRSALVGTVESPKHARYAPPEVHAPNLLAVAQGILSRSF
ncbi:MAG: HAD family hydrolase [Calothrix sp. SM1_5_4]|nr:HAD family hydrolase [Calothrix sp. SM1_5_4]